jgi:hypothetical protein
LNRLSALDSVFTPPLTAATEPPLSSHRTNQLVSLPRGSEIIVTQAMTIVCCITVTAETRTSVAKLAPTVADATERCCAGRIAGLAQEGRQFELTQMMGEQNPWRRRAGDAPPSHLRLAARQVAHARRPRPLLPCFHVDARS